jgi:hypothetical protein
MMHKPSCGWSSVTKLDSIPFKTDNTFTKTLDSKVGFMRLLGALKVKNLLHRQYATFQEALYLRQSSSWEISGRFMVSRVSLAITPSLTSS